MKKFLSLVLALVMTMSLVTVAGAKDFTDDADITYDAAIDVMAACGVIDGYTDGSFRPEVQLNRGQAAKIICNLILGPTTAAALPTSVAPFSDVAAGSTFAGYIAFCAEKGIINGYSDGTFRPTAPLNGYAFMKMLLGVLGYDGAIEGYTGANWAVNVAKQALAIDLESGNDAFNGNAIVTREQACLYAFNMLKANPVEYDTKGTNITIGDITLNSGASKAEADTVSYYEVVFEKLLPNGGTEDAFGRPATVWTYDGEEVATDVAEADYVFTAPTKENAVWKGAGLTVNTGVKTYAVTTNGYDNGTLVVNKTEKTNKLGANGLVIELYNDAAVAVVYTTEIAEVDDVDTNDDDERIVTVAGMDYVTESFEEGDMVLYTGVDKDNADGTIDTIKSMVLAEELTGKVTKKVGTVYTIGGAEYEVSYNCDDSSALVIGDTVDFYLDSYGYIIKVDTAESTVNVDDMAIVISDGNDRDTDWAKMVFLKDGAVKNVDTDVDALDYYDFEDGRAHALVKFEEEKGVYELADFAYTYVASASFTKGTTTFGGAKVDSATKFVYLDNTDDWAMKVYEGYKAAPTFATGVAYTYKLSASTALDLVVVVCDFGTVEDVDDNLTFVVAGAYYDSVDEEEIDTYYVLNAVVDGTIGTLKMDYADFSDNDLVTSYYEGYVKAYKNVKYTDGYMVAADDVDADVFATKTTGFKNDVLDLDGTGYVVADDVAVYFVDKADGTITEGKLSSLVKDTNLTGKNAYAALVAFENSDDEIATLFVVKN